MDLAAHAKAIAESYIPPDTGRPSLLGDAQAVEELLTQVEAGNYVQTACDLAGISYDSVRNWLKRGEAEPGPHRQFLVALKRAESRAEALAVANVRAAGKKPQFWAAEMTYLERRHPDRWARRAESDNAPRVIVQLGVKDSDVTLSVNLSPAPVQQLAELSTGQVEQHSLIIGNYVNSLPAAVGQGLPESGARSTGGTHPAQAAPLPGRGLVAKSAQRGGGKKKGIRKNRPVNGVRPPSGDSQ